MCDDLEDWELEDFTIPNTNIQSEQEKRTLEERKLVEESDLAIAKRLFGNEDYETEMDIQNKQKTIQHEKHKKLISKQHENELKQKELAKIIREKKAAEERHNELYGKYVEDEYSHYEDKLNN